MLLPRSLDPLIFAHKNKMFKKILPILQWLPNYKKADFSGDFTAGLTVGILLIPQGMAYAMIAGLPPVFGLYAALMPQIIYAFMGTSRQLAVGPVAMDSLLVAAGLGALSLSSLESYIAMAVFLALFMGAIQLLLGMVRLGFLVVLLLGQLLLLGLANSNTFWALKLPGVTKYISCFPMPLKTSI
mgnify:CR=1 FL=1